MTNTSEDDLKALTAGVDQLNKQVNEFRNQASARFNDLKDKTGEDIQETKKWLGALEQKLEDCLAANKELATKQAISNYFIANKDDQGLVLQRKTLNAVLRSGGNLAKAEKTLAQDSSFGAPELRQKALSSLRAEDGGFLIPQELGSEIISAALHSGQIRQVVPSRPVSTNKVSFPKGGGVIAGFGNEDAPYPEVTQEQFGLTEIPVWDLKGTIKIPNNLLSDAGFDLVQYFLMEIAQAILSTEEKAFAIGTGFNEPQGIFTHSVLTGAVYDADTNPAGYIKTGVASGLSDITHNGADVFKRDLRYYLHNEYIEGGHYLMNSRTYSELFTLKDDNGQWLIQQGNAGNPSTLFENNVYFNEFIPNIEANAFVAGFGSLAKAYYIVDHVTGLFNWQSTEAGRIEDKLIIGFKKRLGANIVLPEAFKLLKCEA